MWVLHRPFERLLRPFKGPLQRILIGKTLGSLPVWLESAGIHVHVQASDRTPKQLVATLRFMYKFEDPMMRVTGPWH